MKYLCKKTYSKEIIVGKYYEGELTIRDNLIRIKKLYFIQIFDRFAGPKLSDYFYTDKEIRKIKLERLRHIK